MNCRIIRKRDSKRMYVAYELFLENEGGPEFGLSFLMSATKLKKPNSQYSVSTERLDADSYQTKKSGSLAKVRYAFLILKKVINFNFFQKILIVLVFFTKYFFNRSNFTGTQFMLYDTGKSPFKNKKNSNNENTNKISPPISKIQIPTNWRKELLGIFYVSTSNMTIFLILLGAKFVWIQRT
jgi:hypothetical protein